MAYAHEDAAWTLRLAPPHHHHVLLALAHAACRECGVTWFGVRGISDHTGIGITSVRDALARLTREDLIRVFRYPKGGRGRSTEYIVLPQLVKLSTPLCGKCVEKQETHRTGGGFRAKSAGETHQTGGGYSGNPPESGVKTHRTGGGQPGSIHQPVIATASGVREVEASPQGTLNHPPATGRISDEQATENAREVAKIVAVLSRRLTSPTATTPDPEHE